jgi:uncharacterized repeat protein (TIGR01451 family)
MNTSIQLPEPNGIVQPSGDSSRNGATLSAWRKLPGRFTFAGLFAGLLFLLFSAPAARAQGIPPGCTGSGIGITLYTSAPDVHIGDTICYGVTVFNGTGSGPVVCDASNIVAFIVTPDGVSHPVTLLRTYLSNGQSDYYPNYVCYVVRQQDIRPDGTVRATATDTAIIYQNDTPSQGGANQGVNTQVSQPCIGISVQCVGGVGENGLITFTGTVTNCGNNTLVGVTVTNFVNGGPVHVTFINILLTNQVASFSGSWIPLNPCSPSTATFTAQGVDQFTTNPKTVTSSASTTCSEVLTPGIKVTKSCPIQPVAPGQLVTFSGSVSNTGNVTLTNIVVVNNQPAPNTAVFTQASLAPNAVANFTGSYVAPTNCSVADTLTATAISSCGVAVTNSASASCPILTTPQITVTAACPTAPVLSGGSLTYSGTVQNTGNITLTNVVVVSDRPVANTTVLTVTKLAPGASTNFFAGPYTVPANACTVTTTFSGRGKDICTLNAVTNSVSPICTVITAPAIGVTLACPVAPATAGALITYTGFVTNSGNVTLNNVTVVNNQASPSTVLTVPSLAPHASAIFSASFIALTGTCSISSTVTATGSDSCTQAQVSNTASATCTLITTPRIVVTQNCPATYQVIPGGLLIYSGTVSNAGTVTLTNVVVLNNLSGATPVLTNTTLAPGAVTNFTGSYVAPTNCSTTSTSTATGRSVCGVAVTNSASANCPILTAPQITVTVACPTAPVLPGGSLTYSGTVQNTGNITLTNVVVVSDRPAPNTVVFTRATLAPGVSTNFTAGPYTVPANICAVTTTFSGTGKDICTLNAVTNSVSPTCTVITAPAIGVTLACPVAPATAGGLITYTGFVTNSGNVTLNNVTVVDNQASPSTVLTLVSLASHASAIFTASFTAPTDSCSVSSTVTATGSDNCTQLMVTNTASATCPLITTPGIMVTKVCPAQPVAPGQLVTFSGSVSNTGNVTLTNIVVLNNQPVTNTLVFTLASLAPGAVTNFTGSYVAPTNCSVADTLTGTGRSICGVAVTNTASAACPILTAPAIEVTQTCPTTPVGQGGILTYSGTVRNAGNITLTNIVVVNNWPYSSVIFTVASLTPGATTNFTGSYVVPGNCCQAWIWVVASGQGCAGVTVSDTDSGTCTVLTSPQIVVTKVCDPRLSLLRPGDLLTYSGTVSNAGNITLINVTVVDNQPVPGSPLLTINFLAPGESQTYTGSYTVPPDFCGEDTVTANGFDACSYALVSNSATATCPIAHSPRIAITKNCPPLPTQHGGQVIYSGTVSNAGNVTLINVFVVDNQPNNNTPVIGPITLSPGAVFNFSGQYTAPPVCCETTDTVTARGQDRCSGSNVTATATTICPMLYTPGIALLQNCPPNPLPMGSVYNFSGFVTNTGDAILTNVVVFGGQAGTNLTLLGPLDLAPGQSEQYTGSLTVPSNTCAVTITVTGQETCKGTWITNTTSCPIATTPVITITESCPPGPVTNGSSVVFGGSVCNSGNITLTNIFVFSSQSSNTLVLGPITLTPGACAPFAGSYIAIGGCNPTTNLTIVPHSSVIITPTNTVTVTPTNTVIVTPTNAVTVTPTNIVVLTPTNTVTVTPTNIVVLTPTNTVTVTPTNIVILTPTNTVTVTTNNAGTVTTNNTVTITTNTVTPTFGTIDPLTGILTDRFNVPSNLHGLMYADQQENWGPTLFYSTRHPVSGADQFDTISTIPPSVGVVADRFGLTESNYDALTLAAPNVGYGEINFYYIRHDNSGASTFGQIISQGASSSADLWPIAGTGYTGLAFAAANVDNNGANMFYYVRNDTNGLSWFGSINPTPGGIVTNLYTVGTNFDALVYVDLSPIPGWGTDYFAYLRHDNIGSIIGTIDPVTHVVTDRWHLGTNFLSALTFTTTQVGYGPNLFYYLRPAGSGLTTNTVTTYITNTVTTYNTNTVAGFITNTVPGFITNTVPGFITNTVPGFVTNTVPGFVTNTVPGFVTNTVPGFVTNTVPGFVTNTVSGFVTNTVITYTTNRVVSFTPTNTVTAIGMDICQDSVNAAANCGCVASAPPVLVTVTPNVNSDGFFSLSFPTEVGKSYTVQYKDALTDPTWTDLVPPGSVPGTGGPLTIYDSSPAALHPSRFYRVMSTP